MKALQNDRGELKRVKTGVITLPVSAEERYTVVSCLEEVQSFGHATTVCFGYSDTPSSGHSFKDFVAFQINFIKWTATMGDQERPSGDCG